MPTIEIRKQADGATRYTAMVGRISTIGEIYTVDKDHVEAHSRPAAIRTLLILKSGGIGVQLFILGSSADSVAE
jgi:hypothetical protein